MVKYEQYGFIHRQTTCLQEIYTFAESSVATHKIIQEIRKKKRVEKRIKLHILSFCVFFYFREPYILYHLVYLICFYIFPVAFLFSTFLFWLVIVVFCFLFYFNCFLLLFIYLTLLQL